MSPAAGEVEHIWLRGLDDRRADVFVGVGLAGVAGGGVS